MALLIYFMYLFRFLPFVILASLIYSYGYRFPYWDEILYVPLYQRMLEGSLNFSNLLFFQNDHRPMFPRMWTLLIAWLTHWNELAILYSSVGMVFIVFLIFIIQAKSKIKATQINSNKIREFVVIASFSVLLFSWSQMENWVWGLQLMVFMCNASAIGVFYLLSNYKLKKMGFFLAVVLAFVSTFSYASGLLVWISAVPLIINTVLKIKNKNIFPLVVWVLLGVLSVVIYFSGYSRPGISEVGGNAELKDYVSYFLLYVGGTLTGFFTVLPWHGAETIIPKWFAYFFGVVGFLTFLVVLYLSYRVILGENVNKDGGIKPDIEIFLFWLSVGLFSLLSGLVITYGRAGLGVGQALSSRYVSSGALFWCSLVGMTNFLIEKKNFRLGFIDVNGIKRSILNLLIVLIFSVLYLGLMVAPIWHNEKWHKIAWWKNLGWYALCSGYDGKLYWTDLWGTRSDFIDPVFLKNNIFPLFKKYNLCGYEYYTKESVKKELSKIYLREAECFIANKLWKPAICYLETALHMNPELKNEVENYKKYIPPEMFDLYQKYQKNF